MNSDLLELSNNFSLDQLTSFFRKANDKFRLVKEDYSHYLNFENEPISSLEKLGEIELDDVQKLVILAGESARELTSKSGKKRQYEIARKILKDNMYDAGVFVYYDDTGNFRFSLITAFYSGSKREFSSFRRYTYFVSPELPNKTFLKQIGSVCFSSIDELLNAFSLEAVSDDFYDEFKPKFDAIADAVQGNEIAENIKQDFALLFAIRIIFLGFVQKKGWLGGNQQFIQDYWKEYKTQFDGKNEFYTRWLEPLFFEALNSPPGHKVKYQNNDFSSETEEILQLAPFLNGELFKRKSDIDDRGLYIPDNLIEDFFSFLFQYNFTIEENTLYDEELELNPEFLGIIFENLVVKADGAVYTPRIEVDFMCRLSLVKWLQKNSTSTITDLYRLFFREGGRGAEHDEDQKHGDFSPKGIRELIELLENVTVCDPAAGSGAFEVGILHVVNDVLESLYNRPKTSSDLQKPTSFERKSNIIANSLYGVEVKPWAVWINQLRLWLTLFIDMPDEMKTSFKPLLPSLNFKVRCGDSLVQRIGNKSFPVRGHAQISDTIKRKITQLKKEKVEFFYNQFKDVKVLERLELQIFKDIINSEIDKKRGELFGYEEFKEPDMEQSSFFPTPKPKQLKLSVSKEVQKKIEAQISELEDQRDNITDKHPFIWNIEFAEIFFDKGGFDIIIGNPPYVRQEDISDPYDKLTPKEYKTALQQMVRDDYPSYFKPKIKIAGRSDLYTYFYLRSLHLLNPKGIHCFICSNSWLDVGYGVWMQEFLLKNVPIHFIFDNRVKRSFKRADVNTIISLFDAPRKPKKNHQVKFVALKKSFEEVIITEHLLAIEQAYSIDKNDTYRVYPITVEKLINEGTEYETEQQKTLNAGTYIGDKWGGKYLRAPDIFFTILEKGKGKLVKLKDVVDVRRGITTGCNEFFYLTDEQAKYWGIEDEFLKPVIKSPRECKSIVINPDDLKYKLFMCNKSKEELKGTNALKYIEWGEQQEIEVKQAGKKVKIKGFQNITSLKNKRQWWSIKEKDPRILLWPMIHNDRLAMFYNKHMVEVDHNLFEINFDSFPISFCSTITLFSRELFGRANLGEGGLKTEGIDIVQFLIVNPEVINCNKFDDSKFFSREIKSIFIECGIDPESKIPIEEQEPNPLSDRAELDKIVFDALELTEEERKDVYRGVCQLVWDRISKAKSV